jgi:hypothetical protein
LNLIVVPAMYIVVDEFGVNLRNWTARLSGRSAAKPAAEAAAP